MRFFYNAVIAFFTVVGTASPVPEAEDQPDPKSVYIESVTWNGSGCKRGTSDTTASLSDDRKTISVLYSNYVAQSGTGSSASDGRKNCLLNFKLHVPKGWQYTMSNTIFHGFADMGNGGCNGYVKASYWFSGQTGSVGAQYNFPKNALGNYETTTTVQAIWPTCNIPTMFNVNSEAYISCSKNRGQLTVDSIDHTYRETYILSWRRCD
ncbi:hypothetical protein BT63DRAFT_477035 [Microthyrium microscopicum]|uniref:Secreted protein n=1 Tax=Microthyrium microscopicum TaxID=703497 RepID=A0A6A6UJ44_9PEZI|nr:hypothetical protein BT63DRAFT_477035 [Microthyrium microscopicum]